MGNGWDCCLALGWGYYWGRGSGCWLGRAYRLDYLTGGGERLGLLRWAGAITGSDY